MNATAELLVERSGTAHIRWVGPMPLAQAGRRGPPAVGVYLLERAGVPVYVGESRTFRTRLPRHRRNFGFAGMTVRFGMIEAANRTLRRTAEHTLIRSLMRAGYRLRNQSSVRPMRVQPGQTVQVHNHGNRPPYLPPQIHIVGPALYEYFS